MHKEMIRNSFVVFLSMEGWLSNIAFAFWPSLELKGVMTREIEMALAFVVRHPNFQLITGRALVYLFLILKKTWHLFTQP